MKRAFKILGVLIVVLIASRGLISAIQAHKLTAGHDTSAYAIYLTENHDNFAHGNLMPVWAQHLRFGYGEPHLEFRPPLQTYVVEAFYLLCGDLFAAINLSNIFFILVAAAGMFLLLKSVFKLLQTSDENWAPLIGAAAYVLSPYFLTDIYVRGAFSETSCFPVFPWLALAFLRLAADPKPRNLALASFAYAALALSHAGIHLFSLPFLVLAALIYRRQIQSLPAFFAAIALGFAASAHYWAIALGENSLIKSSLLAVDFEAYVGHFVRLDQLFYTPWRVEWGGINYALGFAALVSLGWAIWNWAVSPTGFLTDSYSKLTRVLLMFALLCLYFMHRTSAFWYEAFSWLQIMSFPWRFMTIFTFFVSVLFALAARRILKETWQWAALFTLIAVFGFLKSGATSLQGYTTADFAGPNLATKGFGWAKPYTTPSTAGVMPTVRAENEVQLVSGRGELQCQRKGPTQIDCDIMAVQHSTFRFNAFDYPEWRTIVDEKISTQVKRDPLYGTMLVSLNPGKHSVRWELHDTNLRSIAKAVAITTWIVLLLLLATNRSFGVNAKYFWKRHAS